MKRDPIEGLRVHDFPGAREAARSFLSRRRLRVAEAGFPPWMIPRARIPTPDEVRSWRDNGHVDRIGDHQEMFWDEDNLPALIVAHEYGDNHSYSREHAARFGLGVSIGRSMSWYHPNATLVVFGPPRAKRGYR